MKIYRIECEDGGGPFYHLDGTPRKEGLPVFKGYAPLYGADSLRNLKKLIKNYGLKFSDYILKIYYSDDIISYNKQNGHVVFQVHKEEFETF